MRSFFVAMAAISLSGCATISMVPVESSKSVSLASQPSSLSAAARNFCDLAEGENWVVESKGLLKVAQALFDGEELEDDTKTYAVKIKASEAALPDVLSTVLSDIVEAEQAMADLNRIAMNYLSSAEGAEPNRRDVMRFERALVWGQKAERAFENAIEIAEGRGGDVEQLDVAREALSVRIDETKSIADRLAARYAKLRDVNA